MWIQSVSCISDFLNGLQLGRLPVSYLKLKLNNFHSYNITAQTNKYCKLEKAEFTNFFEEYLSCT
jgi:hypothetical protein